MTIGTEPVIVAGMKRIALLATFAALGLAAALGVTAKPALAYDIAALPAPYTVSQFYNVSAHTGECQTFYVVSWYDRSVTLGYGTAVGGNFSDCNPQFQYRLDEFVDDTINRTPPVTTTVPVTTTTVAATTTTVTPTTTAAPVTTTVATVPAGTVPTVTTTATPPVTVTVTTTIVDPTVNARLTTLEAQYAALAARVDAIAKANTASWDAFSASLAAGGTVADAALAARSAGWNAIYGL